MKKSLQVMPLQSPGCDSNGDHQASNQSIVVPVRTMCIQMAEKFEKKEKSWFPTSQIPTDIIIQVEDNNFYLHKLPLISKSEYLSQLDLCHNSSYGYDIKLDNFPGGAEIFEVVVKFCYGLAVNLTATNVAPLRCAAEYLQMTEEYEEGNLISKTEAFLTFIILSSWRDPVTVMKSCESLSPWVENLHILRRCSDAIASMVIRLHSTSNETHNEERWWFDDVSILCTDHFARIVTAITAKGSKPETIGACIMHYVEKHLPGMEADLGGQRECGYGINELHISILSGRREEDLVGQNRKQRRMIEVLVSILPPQREAVSCKFLLRMLKLALVYSVTPVLASELEKKVGMRLEDVVAEDLLIPNYNNGTEGRTDSPSSQESPMHDIDIVQRMVEYYLMHEQQQQMGGLLDVGKLLDGYLAEVAKDPNLSICKFQALAQALPQNARICHDGLYRAIDIYLKNHPTLKEHDRRRLCKEMDSGKLSIDACMHAAQNDRLPLRNVMQVLFSEQIKMRSTMQEKDITQDQVVSDEDRKPSSKEEIQKVILELEKIKTSIAELQHGYSDLQREVGKINEQRDVSGRSSKWKKFVNSTLFHGKINDIGIGVQLGKKSGSSRMRRRSLS